MKKAVALENGEPGHLEQKLLEMTTALHRGGRGGQKIPFERKRMDMPTYMIVSKLVFFLKIHIPTVKMIPLHSDQIVPPFSFVVVLVSLPKHIPKAYLLNQPCQLLFLASASPGAENKKHSVNPCGDITSGGPIR